MDYSLVEGLKDLCMTEKSGQLCQFVYCCRWMALPSPNFVSPVAPLTDLLESAYASVGRRTRRDILELSVRTFSSGVLCTKIDFVTDNTAIATL